MESAQNDTTANVLECQVHNMRFSVKTVTDIMRSNGYAIAARSKIRKSPRVKCLSHGAR